jgi:Na+/H+-dicarboxylate symporter
MSTPNEETQGKKTETESVQEDYEQAPPSGCGILGRYPVLSVLFFAVVGIGVGVGLSYWEPDDPEDKEKTLKWIGLIGDLFIRSLKCVVLPLVFINVVISVVDMMTVGKAGSVGWKTIGLYLLTTIIAAILGIISSVSFKGLFEEDAFADARPPTIQLGCNEDGSFLSEMSDGSLMCTADYGEEGNTEFTIVDITSSFMKNGGGAKNDISLSDTVYDGVFTKLVTSNIAGAFVSANFAGVVAFAIAFGVALSRVLDKKKANEMNFIMPFFKELDGVFITLINWIIMVTPFAVFSLIIKAIGSQSNLADKFANVGYLMVATIIAMLAHFVVVHCGLFYAITKTSPFPYLRHLIPAQTMAFACASSAATIPMTLRCVKATGRVPDPVARFVIPLGATVNMDGGAIYFPCACIWLAILNGIDPDVSNYILLIIISTIGSIGTAPVPSASLVLIITAYNTVFNTTGTPEGFSYILAIDWFMDRLRTTLNVTGDAVVSGMVAHVCKMEAEETYNELNGAKMEARSSEEESEEDARKEIAA